MTHRSTRTFVALAATVAMLLPVAGLCAPQKKKPAPKKPAPVKKADPKAGMALFASEGCKTCHKTKDHADGGAMKDLSKVAGEMNAAQLTAFIKNPAPKAPAMPAFKGSPDALANIVAYLGTQK